MDIRTRSQIGLEATVFYAIGTVIVLASLTFLRKLYNARSRMLRLRNRGLVLRWTLESTYSVANPL